MKRYRTWIIIVVVFGLLVAAAPKIVRLVEINRYVRQVREARYLIEKVQARRPPDCPAGIWEDALTWTSIAFANIFFSPELASHSERIDAANRKYGAFAHRGPGDFYALYFNLSGELAEARRWPPPAPDASESK
jgi:hypothetical protein